jgi:hypothetical protein
LHEKSSCENWCCTWENTQNPLSIARLQASDQTHLPICMTKAAVSTGAARGRSHDTLCPLQDCRLQIKRIDQICMTKAAVSTGAARGKIHKILCPLQDCRLLIKRIDQICMTKAAVSTGAARGKTHKILCPLQDCMQASDQRH